jgi:hypothetical protein
MNWLYAIAPFTRDRWELVERITKNLLNQKIHKYTTLHYTTLEVLSYRFSCFLAISN